MTGLEFVVSARERLADGVLGLSLVRADGGAVPVWEPGAHIDLVLREGLVRQYSLCGDPADRSRLRVAVLREPAGRGGSAFVHEELSEGSRVLVDGPRNHFGLVEADRYLFIAGGVGITPILPMIGAVSGSDWRLVYGGRTRSSMAFADELAALGDRVEIRPQDEFGLLDVPGLLAEPRSGTAIYCCGPGPLLDAVVAGASGWPAGAVQVERFAPVAVSGVEVGFTVELARSGRSVEVAAGVPVLVALEEAGVAVLSSCREGTCGTCETEVLAGVVDHRDSVLTEAERVAGDTMLVCVSRAVGSRLVLDL